MSHSLCKLHLLNLISPFYWISKPFCYHPQRCERSVFLEIGRRSFHYKFLHSAAHICSYQRVPGSDFLKTTYLSSSLADNHLLEFLGMKVVIPAGPNEGSASADTYNMRYLHVNYMTTWLWPDSLTLKLYHRRKSPSCRTGVGNPICWKSHIGPKTNKITNLSGGAKNKILHYKVYTSL